MGDVCRVVATKTTNLDDLEAVVVFVRNHSGCE